MLLYLIVLIKSKPSTEGEKTPKKGSLKQTIRKAFSTERRNKPVLSYKTREEPAERVKAIERPKLVSTVHACIPD